MQFQFLLTGRNRGICDQKTALHIWAVEMVSSWDAAFCSEVFANIQAGDSFAKMKVRNSGLRNKIGLWTYELDHVGQIHGHRSLRRWHRPTMNPPQILMPCD